jgi:hypothetical protein
MYHPSYDAHHCAYRYLNILISSSNKKLDLSILSIVDFYYLYPHLLQQVEKLPSPIHRYKSVIKSIKKPFEVTPNAKALYFDLKSLQSVALANLQYRGLIAVSNKNVSLVTELLPKSLIKKFEDDVFRDTEIFKLLVKELPKVNMSGKNGFKARSGLMEYKYD